MADDISILNDLLDLQWQSMITRLGEAPPYAGAAEAESVALLQEMVADEAEHVRLLTATIQALGGAPRPRVYHAQHARVQYHDLSYLLPLLIGDKQHTLDAYRGKAGQTRDGDSAKLVADITQRHETHLGRLQALATSRTPTPS
ncbi:MAG: ferritin-like domain-containing protein [Planctomycetes bacterium]|nr:ferritin-like domain-containing protein [Planctomycetota bacterium]